MGKLKTAPTQAGARAQNEKFYSHLSVSPMFKFPCSQCGGLSLSSLGSWSWSWSCSLILLFAIRIKSRRFFQSYITTLDD